MAIAWDETRIAALADAELLQLRLNAVRKLNTPIMDLCEAEISKRGVTTRPKRAPSAASQTPLRMRENEMSAELGAFAQELARDYDLTGETAREQSKGTPRFQPHKLTQSNGTAKLGGLQRAGKCKIDRYVSYRVKDTVVSLNMFLGKDAADNAVAFQVFGPQEFLPDGKSIDALRPGLGEEAESKYFPWGQQFTRLGEAKAAFTLVLSKVATRRVA